MVFKHKDVVRIALIHNGSVYLQELNELLNKIFEKDQVAVLSPWDKIDGYDAYVFSGRSSRTQTKLKDIFRLIERIVDKPSLYICFGAEAFNMYLGGTLKVLESFLKGEITIEFKGSSYFADGAYNFYVSRHLNIGRLNKYSKPVAFSKFGVEAFEYRNSFALMFHPEKSNSQGERLVKSFFEKSLKT